MECFVCNQQAEERPSAGDYTAVSCSDCGTYRLSGTVAGELTLRARWLNTELMQQWLEEQRNTGDKDPMITTAVALWDGVWVQR